MPQDVEHEMNDLPKWLRMLLAVIKSQGVAFFVMCILLGMVTGHVSSPAYEQSKNNFKVVETNQSIMSKTQEDMRRHLEEERKHDLRQAGVDTIRCINDAKAANTSAEAVNDCIEIQTASEYRRKRIIEEAISRKP